MKLTVCSELELVLNEVTVCSQSEQYYIGLFSAAALLTCTSNLAFVGTVFTSLKGELVPRKVSGVTSERQVEQLRTKKGDDVQSSRLSAPVFTLALLLEMDLTLR